MNTWMTGGILLAVAAQASAQLSMNPRIGTGPTRIALFATLHQADFVVEQIRREPDGLRVRVANRGAAGVVKTVWCRSLGVAGPRRVYRGVSIPLIGGARAESSVPWHHLAGERVACYVDGVDQFGAPEVVTARNGRVLLP